MPEEPTGTPPPTGQAPVEPSVPAGQAPVTTLQIPDEIKQQLEDANKRAQQAEESARYHQSQADRFRAALGAPNQVDPNQQAEAQAKLLAAKHGVSLEDVKRLMPMIYDLNAPLVQELQSLKAGQINGQSVETAMRAAFQQNPTLLGQPGLYERTEAALRQSIAQNPNPITVEELQNSALFTAGGLAAMMPPPTGQTAPPLAQPHPLSFRSMTGIPSSVSAPAPVQNAAPTDTQMKIRNMFTTAIEQSKRKP